MPRNPSSGRLSALLLWHQLRQRCICIRVHCGHCQNAITGLDLQDKKFRAGSQALGGIALKCKVEWKRVEEIFQKSGKSDGKIALFHGAYPHASMMYCCLLAIC